MAVETRKRGRLPSPGPFLAEITNLLDPTYMGALEVSLIKTLQNSVDNQEGTYVVRHLNPFYGVTSARFEGNNSSSFNDVQKSYGMWFVPPDVGTVVMVIFIDGDPNQGYWMGCVADQFQNHMVPGIAASQTTAMTQEQKDRYGTSYLPVGEFLKGTQSLNVPNVDKIPKPVHPFADRLVQQGLLLDTVRGVTSSSARREVPSQVFGISTPGPLDTSPGARTGTVGYEEKRQAPISRLGGSTFVMDDGDINGQNELVRIRTRTGHQILLHNSQDLIYIANGQGTAWIELTGNGKIDMYAADSVSIHTEADFNFRADRDINIEAGRNINMRAIKNMETNVAGFYNLVIDDYAKISVRNDLNQTVGETAKYSVGTDYHLSVGKSIFSSAGDTMNIIGGEGIKIGSGGVFSVDSNGNIIMVGPQVHMNGPAAEEPGSPEIAEVPPLLNIFKLPNRDVRYGWGPNKFYNTGTISTIMQRVPTHEPYDQHENVNPQKFSSAATDVTNGPSRASGGIPDSPNQGIQEPANQPEITPGTCDPNYAKDINLSSSQAGISAIKAACAKANITNTYMIATMLGVAGGESLWKLVTENFNYSAPRLLQVFPSVFKGDQALAQQYAGNPNNSLPEFLYGYQTAKGRGLGNTEPGDGFKYIGRGYIGLTGRANYTKFSKLLFEKGFTSDVNALVNKPELVNDPAIAGAIVVLYFLSHPRLTKGPNANPGPGYFEEGYKAVGFCTPDIYNRKKGYYECFLGQLQAKTVSAGGTNSNGILTDSSGNPIRTGQ
jgi:predicted chitinase